MSTPNMGHPSQTVREKEAQASFHFLSGRVLGVRKGGWSQACCVTGIVFQAGYIRGLEKPLEISSRILLCTLSGRSQQPVSSQPGKL